MERGLQMVYREFLVTWRNVKKTCLMRQYAASQSIRGAVKMNQADIQE